MPKKVTRVSSVNWEQELVIRNFIVNSEAVNLQLPRGILPTLLGLIGYKLAPNGARVHNAVQLRHRYGTDMDKVYKDTFYEDWQEITDAEAKADSGTSEQTEGN
jgi:hypothetical protein